MLDYNFIKDRLSTEKLLTRVALHLKLRNNALAINDLNKVLELEKNNIVLDSQKINELISLLKDKNNNTTQIGNLTISILDAFNMFLPFMIF